MIYQISAGSKSFGTKTLFRGINFQIRNREKTALIGRNGTGKTTLLRIIAGEEELDEGEIHQPAGLTIGYLRQNAFPDESLTVQRRLDQIYAPLFEKKRRLETLAERMKSDQSEEILASYAKLEEQFEREGGYTFQSEQKMVLGKFGFSDADLGRQLSSFSGGQKTRIAFACLLLEKPDILLLDEPTNHLDLETIEWLEGYLRKYPRAVVTASHDRAFLDEVVSQVYELEFERLTLWHGNYSSYLEQKKADRVRRQEAYDRQQREIKRLEDLIERFRYKKNKAAFAQSKIKYLDRMEKVEAPKAEKRNFKPRFTVRVQGGKKVLQTKDLVIGYDRPLCRVNLEVQRGQRIAIIGPNGQGKSTLVKTLVGSVSPISGEYLFGHQIEIGYFDQELAQFTSGKTVLDELWDAYPEYDRTQIRTTLGSFLFTADDVFKTVDVLSGGEKVRLYLAKLMLKQANCLILDEPTNHLDIPGREALENALTGYEGTLLLVSHDRWLIDRTATSLLILSGGKASYYPYTYKEYLQGGALSQQREAEEKGRKEEKKEEKPRRPVNWSKEVRKLEERVTKAEDELEAMRGLRYEPEYYHDYRKMDELEEKISEKHNEIARLMEQWEEAEAQLESDSDRK